MSEIPYQGWLHHNDGDLFIVGMDGFCHEPDRVTEIIEAADTATTPALDVPTIDVTPESVTDREAGQREL
ncbi:hypothetical protein [Nocardia africana]